MAGRLAGKVVIVTGGGAGIGRGVSTRCASEGAAVVIAELDAGLGAETARLITDGGGRAIFAHTDVTDEASVAACVATAEAAFGPVSGLVNVAGIYPRATLDNTTVALWDRIMDVNLKGPFLMCRAAVASMRKGGGGSIVNFSSVSYHTMTPHLSVYQSAKAAVIGMSRGLARDLGEHKIRVNSITPGWIMTQRQIELWLTPEAEAQLMQLQCLKEKVYPPDIARMALFLGADDSRMITAQTFVVDGGRM